MEQLRCFIAIELPPEIRAELAALLGRLRAGRYSFARWVNPEGIHLTLKFLGEVPAARLPEITGAISRASRGKSPFSLHLGGLGAFPGWQRPRVVWIGIEGDTAKLIALQQAIETTVSPLGFTTEPRSFTPHLTLARLREIPSAEERQQFAQQVSGAKPSSPLPFIVKDLALMRSQLAPSGAIYSRLATIEL